MIAIAYTVLFCGLGVQMIRWLMPKKSPPVRAWLGVSLGVLMEMCLPALCANLLDFTFAAALLLAAVCYAAREKAPLCAKRESDRRQLAVMAAVGVSLGVLMEMCLPALCANLLDFTFAAHIAAVAAVLLLAAVCYAAREKAPLCAMRESDRRQLAVMAAVGVSLGVLDGNVPSGALRQSAGFHVRRAHRGRRRGAAAGGGLLCRAGKSAAVRHAGIGQAAAGRDGRRGPSADGALGLSAIHPLHHARVGRVVLVRPNPPTAICACICRLSRRWKT